MARSIRSLRQVTILRHHHKARAPLRSSIQGYVNIADFAIIKISTKSATRFLFKDFQPNYLKPSDHYPRHLALKTKRSDQMHKPNEPSE